MTERKSDALAKTNRMNMLFDYYGSLLTEKQRLYMSYYFHEDYSLGEIAEQFRISRQAIYEHIKRAEAVLEEYEEKLQLLAKHERRLEAAAQIEEELAKWGNSPEADRIRRWLSEIMNAT